MTAAELRQAIAQHREKRPDPIKATDPASPKCLYVEWQKWCADLERLKTQLGMAEAEEAPRWVDTVTGKPVKPIFWTYGHSDIHHIKSLSQKMTPQEAGKLGGRPRSANPSKDALRLREKRAKVAA